MVSRKYSCVVVYVMEEFERGKQFFPVDLVFQAVAPIKKYPYTPFFAK